MAESSVPPGDRCDAAEDFGDGLTCIRDAYTLASTAEQWSETDKLMINNFLNTLAEVAIAVANRNINSEEEGT